MILVRFVLQAKFGMAGKLIEQVKKESEIIQKITGREIPMRILTDLSGPFDTIVHEVVLESLAAWEELRARIFADPEFQDNLSTSENAYLGGRTEFYTIEAAF